MFRRLGGEPRGDTAAETQYRAAREADGYRRRDPQYFRDLPHVPDDDPHADRWRVRQATYARFTSHALWRLRGSQRMADLGAGCGWLAARVAALGHHVVAVDRRDDELDGLGACRHYETAFMALQADFEALPIASEQFDVVVFNASLHYAENPSRALTEARRVLASGGAIAVLDSPMFATASDGEAMVRAELVRLQRDCGIAAPQRLGAGFLTYDGLDAAAAALGLVARFIPTRGPWTWRLKRAVGAVRVGRPPAAFGVWIAR
ncbi:MAG: class I SAM-dependent methyltransferase [Vicinamibacterales bacterium]